MLCFTSAGTGAGVHADVIILVGIGVGGGVVLPFAIVLVGVGGGWCWCWHGVFVVRFRAGVCPFVVVFGGGGRGGDVSLFVVLIKVVLVLMWRVRSLTGSRSCGCFLVRCIRH